MNDGKHENYRLLNLIGYGLAKFDMAFVKRFGFGTKTAFYQNMVQRGIAETTGTIKNRQDLFDPFFDNGRKGWWQKGDAYIHRKILIDSLYGDLDAQQLADVVNLHLEAEFSSTELAPVISPVISPVMKSKYRQLQMTGREAELYFMLNYQKITSFEAGTLEDARLFGDGYDFQIQVSGRYLLAEIKGIRATYGGLRLTNNEFEKASEYRGEYAVVVVSNLDDVPKMTAVFDPTKRLRLTRRAVSREQISYHSEAILW